MFKKTKIVCTIGPASNNEETLLQMIDAGMNVARLNFSHGTHEQHKITYDLLRKCSEIRQTQIAILQDLQGPKIRLGDFDGIFVLKKGDTVTLSQSEYSQDKKILPFPHPEIIADIEAGEKLLLDDGLVELKVIRKENGILICSVERGDQLSAHKGVNLPDSDLKTPALTSKDHEDLLFGINLGVDFVALSFVRTASDIRQVKDIIASNNKNIPVIAKIEKPQAVQNIHEILDESYGIMVARGDLGVEMPYYKAPLIQKKLIRLANRAAKPVITATQMLDSMKSNAIPTRAETTDVANSILDGTDAVMLSQETATGKYPVKSVETMAHIAKEIEMKFEYEKWTRRNFEAKNSVYDESICHSACHIAEQIKAKAVVAKTISGATARRIAKFRPRCTVLALSPSIETVRALTLSFGVKAVFVDWFKTADEIFSSVECISAMHVHAHPGDHIVMTAGLPFSDKQRTNLIRIFTISKQEDT